MSRKLPYPVFDADNHMYEAKDAFTRYLPPKYAGVIKYVEINGRTKIAIKNKISEYIPNPTFNKVAPPGAQELEFRLKNPSSTTQARGHPARAAAEVHRGAPGLLRPRSPHHAHGRPQHRPGDDVADTREPARGTSGRRPRRHPRGDPRVQPVDARGVDVQLRRPHLPDPGDHPADRRPGDRGARVGRVPRGQGDPRPARAGPRLQRSSPLVRAAGVRPVLGGGARGRCRRRHARVRQR